MAFVERLKIILDFEGDHTTKGLRAIGKEISNTEGFWNKLKVGANGAKGALTDFITSGAGAATTAAVLGAGLYKAVDAAADLGQEVGKLSDATGLTTEQASRWLEVADDMGIGADKVAGLIEKMTKNLGAAPEKFKELGIEIQYAADGTADMNATMLLAIDRINAISDPTKKAKAAADLFGKSWADASELVGMSSSEIKKRLDDVADAKVFSKEDVKASREYRDAIANLEDTLGDLAISIGKELVPAITALAKGTKTVTDFGDAVGGFDVTPAGDALGYVKDQALGLESGLQASVRAAIQAREAFNDLPPTLIQVGDASKETAQAEYEQSQAADTAKRSSKALASVLDDQADAARRAAEGSRDAESSALDMADAYDDMNEAVQHSIDVSNDENATQAEKDRAYRDVRRSQLEAAATAKKHAEDVAASSGAVAGSTANTRLQIAELNRQKALYPELSALIDDYIRELNRIPGTVTTNVGIRYGGGSGGTGANGSGASGDTGNLNLGSGSGNVQRVQSVGDTRSGAPIIVQLMLDGRAIAEITAYQEQQKRGSR